MANHLYKVNDDNTLTLPTGKTMDIIDGSVCAQNPEKYYKMIDGSPFGETLYPIRFYKKTLVTKLDYGGHAITQLIVPPGTKFHIEYLPPRQIGAKFRFEKAIVSDQHNISRYKPYKIDITFSAKKRNFSYVSGKLVEPEAPFHDYNKWLLEEKLDATCRSGIHAYASITEAKNHYIT
jgi:hypothetical protein